MRVLRIVVACVALTALSGACKTGDNEKTDSSPKTSAPPVTPSASAPQKATGLLDGVYFEGMVGAEGNPDGGNDIANFYDGMLTSRYFRGQGFRPAVYSSNITDTLTTFHAEWTDTLLGSFNWNGQIAGDTLISTALYVPLSGDSIKYWWEGSRSSEDSIRAKHLAARGRQLPRSGAADSAKTR